MSFVAVVASDRRFEGRLACVAIHTCSLLTDILSSVEVGCRVQVLLKHGLVVVKLGGAVPAGAYLG